METTIYVNAEVGVSVADVLEHLEYSDIRAWVGELSEVERREFLEELTVDEPTLEDALETVSKAFHHSPYQKGRVEDALTVAGILKKVAYRKRNP